MQSYLYTRLIEPRSDNADTRSRELVLNCLLIASIVLMAGESLDLLFGLVFLGHHYLVWRLLGLTAVTGFLVLTYWLGRRYYRLGSAILVCVFLLAGSYLAYRWGTMTPTGLLIFGLAIVMSGILLGAKYSLVLTGFIIALMVGFEGCSAHRIIQPNLSWKTRSSSVSDVIAVGSIYLVMATVSWLFNLQMERALRRSRRSEAALLKQKAQLEVQVTKRSRQLVAEQLDKVQQIYRLAELGRVSSALFHDMANHLANVTLDIEGLSQQHPEIMKQIRHDINYIDDVVDRVRVQLRGDSRLEHFIVNDQIREIIKILRPRAQKASVGIRFYQGKSPVLFTCDLMRLRQVIINLLSNAIDAYPATTISTTKKAKPRLVVIELESTPKQVVIKVIDRGQGIKTSQKKRIFEPFFSTKADGIGIGLFMVKQIVERDLNGKISFSSSIENGTIFSVKLPVGRQLGGKNER